MRISSCTLPSGTVSREPMRFHNGSPATSSRPSATRCSGSSPTRTHRHPLTLSPDDGIVVVWRSRKGDVPMDFQSVPASLQDRLGAEGSVDLVRLFETARAEWSNDVLNLSLERFERRLVQEITGLRVEMVRGQATLREELAQQGAS